MDGTGGLSLAGAGSVTTFDPAGRPTGITSALDDAQPAATRLSSGGTPTRLQSITDPVSGRAVALRYGADGACGGPVPPGFAATAPAGMACAADYWDGTRSRFWYTGNQLGRIEDPGGRVTDFAYDADGRLVSVREPLAADAVAAGVAPPDDTSRTVIAYPAPQGHHRRFGHRPRPQPRRRPAGAWLLLQPHPEPRPGRRAQPTGRLRPQAHLRRRRASPHRHRRHRQGQFHHLEPRRPAHLDHRRRRAADHRRLRLRPPPTDAWRPAPAGCFGADNRPNATCAPMAHTVTAYDAGLTGLGATYWANPDLAGAPAAHATGVGDPSGAQLADFATTGGLPTIAGGSALVAGAWSARYRGEITLPAAGSYRFRANRTGSVSLRIDDTRPKKLRRPHPHRCNMYLSGSHLPAATARDESIGAEVAGLACFVLAQRDPAGGLLALRRGSG